MSENVDGAMARKRRSPASPAKAPQKDTKLAPAPTKKSDATRLRILDAAARVVSREGFAGAKLSDVAAEAKVKIATLYYYFESRDELVQSVLETGAEQVRVHVQEAVARLDPNTSRVDRLCAAVESHLRFILEISAYTEAAVRNSSQVPEHMRSSIRAGQAKYGRFWQELVDAALSPGDGLTSTQRRAMRMFVMGGLNWTVEWWNPRQMPIDELVATSVSTVRAIFRRGDDVQAADRGEKR